MRGLRYLRAVESRYQRDGIESPIVDTCNLSCRHCNSLSPFFARDSYTFDEFRKDLDHLATLVKVREFDLLGGEPCILHNLSSYVAAVRKSGICDVIAILTNGRNLHEVRHRPVLDAVDEVRVSYYPSVDNSALDRWLMGDGARYAGKVKVFRFDAFTVFFEPRKRSPSETEKTWRGCWLRHRCHNIYRGRYYLCPPSNKFKHLLRARYGVTEDLEDGIDIRSIRTGEELAAAVSALSGGDTPLKTCSYCLPWEGRLETHAQEPVEKIL